MCWTSWRAQVKGVYVVYESIKVLESCVWKGLGAQIFLFPPFPDSIEMFCWRLAHLLG